MIAAAGAGLLCLAPLPATAVAHADTTNCQPNADGTRAYCDGYRGDGSHYSYEIYCNLDTGSCETQPQ
jgi:hypothetical protein